VLRREHQHRLNGLKGGRNSGLRQVLMSSANDILTGSRRFITAIEENSVPNVTRMTDRRVLAA
jgi:hypothetical protein